MANKDYYQILGVSKGATKDEIKKAFHKLAHKYHPDKKEGDEAKFKEVNEAYQILSDEKKRQQYDAFGSNPGGFGGAGFDPSGFGFDFSQAGQNGFEFDLGDIFGDIFGGGRSGRGPTRGRDMSVDIQVTFAESIFGTERKILINKTALCATCSGSGAKPGSTLKTCSVCNGKGKLQENRRSIFGTFSSTRPCETCQGSGQVPEQACSSCGGVGTVNKREEVTVVVPPGVDSGEMIRLPNQGEAVGKGGVAGDLYVRVHVEKHATLRRDGINLRRELEVKLSDALLGADYPVETLDGTLQVKIPAGVTHGEILRVRGKGVPYKPGKRGDLLLGIHLKLPTKLSKKAQKLVEELKGEGV